MCSHAFRFFKFDFFMGIVQRYSMVKKNVKKNKTIKQAISLARRQGRPAKYQEPSEIVPIINDYFKDFNKLDRKDPYLISGLQLALDMDDHTWADYLNKPGFNQVLMKARKMIEHDVLRMAIRGRIQPVFSIFYAKNVFGWSDKQEVQNNVKFDIAEELREALQTVNSPVTSKNINPKQLEAKE